MDPINLGDAASITLNIDPMTLVLIVMYLWRSYAQEHRLRRDLRPSDEFAQALRQLVQDAAERNEQKATGKISP